MWGMEDTPKFLAAEHELWEDLSDEREGFEAHFEDLKKGKEEIWECEDKYSTAKFTFVLADG